MTYSYFFECDNIICKNIDTNQIANAMSGLGLDDFTSMNCLKLPFRFCTRIPIEIQYVLYEEISSKIENDDIKTVFDYIYLNPMTYALIGIENLDSHLQHFFDNYIFKKPERIFKVKNCGCNKDVLTIWDKTISLHDEKIMEIKKAFQEGEVNIITTKHDKHDYYNGKTYLELNMMSHSKLRIAKLKILTIKEIEKKRKNEKNKKEKERKLKARRKLKYSVQKDNNNFSMPFNHRFILDKDLYEEMFPFDLEEKYLITLDY